MSLLVVEHERDCGPGRLAAGLGDVDLRRPYAGDELPATLAGHSGLVVLGGDMAAWDDDGHPWLPHTRRLLATAVRSGLPTLGVCLGAQLLALAAGGRVERGAVMEVGLATVHVLPAAAGDRLLGPVLARLGRAPGEPIAVPHYHRDAVTELPPGAELLATGDVYPVQAFRIGPAAWGVQYHPEVTADSFAAWMRDGHDDLVGRGLDPAALGAAVEAEGAHLDGLAAAHADAFTAVAAALSGARGPRA